jgi:DNA-binding MarR family transcriptional regulator
VVTFMSEHEFELPELADATIAMQHLIAVSRELAARAARELGVNATDMNALALLEQYGPMGPAELAARLGIRTASATVLIDRLEQAGHVERSAHPDDRRRVTVAATASAHRAVLDFLRPSILAVDDIGRALGPEAHGVVTKYLDDAVRAMRATGK